MQTDRTIPVENTDPDQMDTLEDNILLDQMDISDDDQMDWQVEEPLAPGMTNLQIESCLKGYPATVCCADELPLHVGVKPHTFIVNTDTSDRGGSHWVAFHFPSWDPTNFSIRWETHQKRTTSVSPTSWSSITDRNTTTVRFKSNPTTPTPADCIACTTSNGDIDERGQNFKI